MRAAKDGRILIGATIERAGFDVRVTPEGMDALIGAAVDALPRLQELTIVESWAGTRPGSIDALPFIGATGVDGGFVASGLFRHGIMLAPAAARLIADLIEGRPLPAYAQAFSPLRATATVGTPGGFGEIIIRARTFGAQCAAL